MTECFKNVKHFHICGVHFSVIVKAKTRHDTILKQSGGTGKTRNDMIFNQSGGIAKTRQNMI